MQTKQIDDLIRQALKDEDQEFLRSLEEPTLSEEMTSIFQGRWRYLNAMGIVVSLGLFAVGAFSVFRFVQADDTLSALRWGALAMFGMGGVSYMKLWYWLELERHATTREIKRVELQVAHLVASLGSRRQ